MQYCIYVVTPRGYSHSSSFKETAENLQYAFMELGYDVPIVRSSNAVPRTHRPIIIGANLLKAGDTVPDVFIPIIYNLEQLSLSSGNSWTTTEYLALLKRHVVWDYSVSNISFLQCMGINARLLEIGYSRNMTRIPNPDTKTIDVLFYGCVNERRKKILDKLQYSGLKVKSLFNVYGKERDDYVSRSKVVLNMHYYESKVFEITRCFYLMSNKKCIVSERGNDKELEGKYEDGIRFADYDALVGNCLDLVHADNVRRGLEVKGFEIFSRVNQAEYLQKVLE